MMRVKNPHAVALGALGGKAKAKPTVCPRCNKLQPSARAAWVHCRKPRARMRQAGTKAAPTEKPVAGKGK